MIKRPVKGVWARSLGLLVLFGASSGMAASFYPVEAQHSQKLLDVEGAGVGSGTDVVQWQDYGGTNQRWSFERDSSGRTFTVKAQHSGLCLSMNGQWVDNVEQRSCDGSDRQRWTLQQSANGFHIINEGVAGACISVVATDGGTAATENGAWVLGEPCSGASHQSFAINGLAAASANLVALQNLETGKYLQLGNGATQGSWSNGTQQQWTQIAQGNNVYTFKNLSNSQCLDLEDLAQSSTTQGNGVLVRPCNNSPSQQWTRSGSDSNFEWVNGQNNECLAIGQGSTAEDAPAITWPCGGYDDQAWKVSWLAADTASPVASNTPSVVDSTEDQKAMGYPDTRKSVRDSQGNLYVAYRKKDSSGKYQIFVRTSADQGASWQPLGSDEPVLKVDGQTQRVPSLAIDGNDNLHIAWYGLMNRNETGYVAGRQIRYCRYTASSQTWEACQVVGKQDGYSLAYLDPIPGVREGWGKPNTGGNKDYWQEHANISVFKDAQGNDQVFIVWEGRDFDTKKVSTSPNMAKARLAYSSDGGTTWSSSFVVGDVPNQGSFKTRSRPSLVMNSQNKVFVAVYGKLQGGNDQDILWTRFDFPPVQSAMSQGWTAANEGGGEARHLSMSIDANDLLHLVWRQGTVNKATVRYRSLDTTATTLTWGPQVEIAPTSGELQMFPSVASAAGDVYVSWTETVGYSNNPLGYPNEAPDAGYAVATKTVLAKKLGTAAWQSSDVVTPNAGEGNTWWGSLRWSRDYLNGGAVDVVYERAAAGGGYEVVQRSVVNWGQ